MRPQILFPLFAPITSLSGIGQRLAKPLERLCGPRVLDLVRHLPSGLLDRRANAPLARAENGHIVTLVVRVERHAKPRNPRQPYKVRCSDQTGSIDLVFFNAREEYLTQILPVGAARAISGRLEKFGSELTMVHPDHIVPAEDLAKIQIIEPIYPLTAGLTAKVLRKAIDLALKRVPEFPEWLDPAFRTKRGWSGFRDALLSAHHPTDPRDLEPSHPIRARLAYDELLSNQLALALIRQRHRGRPGRASVGTGALTAKVLAGLAYELTAGQRSAWQEIAADMGSSHRMLRLLQGDVGSGKTVVAFLAMLTAVEASGQAALLAPTDVLARQHLQNLTPLAALAGLEIALLTGRDKTKSREAGLAGLADGTIRLAIGTHALLQEDVAFSDLRLAVIDEQHRFGVAQRAALVEKGGQVDLLVMTATPIPRTLALTSYGDIEVSRLLEKPAGRQPIDTRTVPLERLDEVVDRLKRAINQGAKVYWVCPLVEESENVDAAAVIARSESLSTIFGDRVGLVHGKQKTSERDAIISAFAHGPISILVATTVIEVGVDIPDANIMVVEHAERFGLAQLHQLRGRVGRGGRKSSCLLLYQNPLGETAKARLNILRKTNDGFVIAEEDLRLRGGGEMLGQRQSGLPNFHFADLFQHGELLTVARDDAKLILSRDQQLESPRGQALRILLYLFEHDASVRTLRGG